MADGIALGEFMANRNYAWLHENLKKAKAAHIFPQVLNGGFFRGESGGTGVLAAGG